MKRSNHRGIPTAIPSLARLALLSFAVLSLPLAGCRSEEVAACEATDPAAEHPTGDPVVRDAPSRPTPQADAAIEQPNNDCWWYRPGERSLVAVWVSPRLPGQVPGGFRFVNVFLHDGGPERAVLLHSNPVHSVRRDHVGVRGDGRSVRVTPVQGKTWSQVVDRKDLIVQVDGS